MKYIEFNSLLKEKTKIGYIFKNPGRGTSTIKSIDNERIIYIRGKSKIYINIEDIYNVYVFYRGKCINTNDLKEYKPEVFDTKRNGHDCNCTVTMMILCNMKLADEIKGKGVRNNPFYTKII